MKSLGLLCTFCHDVDDAVHGICSPQCSARSAHNFDAVQVFQGCELSVPVYSAKKRIVDGSAIDHHQKLVGQDASRRRQTIESPRGNAPIMRVCLPDLKVRG